MYSFSGRHHCRLHLFLRCHHPSCASCVTRALIQQAGHRRWLTPIGQCHPVAANRCPDDAGVDQFPISCEFVESNRGLQGLRRHNLTFPCGRSIRCQPGLVMLGSDAEAAGRGRWSGSASPEQQHLIVVDPSPGALPPVGPVVHLPVFPVVCSRGGRGTERQPATQPCRRCGPNLVRRGGPAKRGAGGGAGAGAGANHATGRAISVRPGRHGRKGGASSMLAADGREPGRLSVDSSRRTDPFDAAANRDNSRRLCLTTAPRRRRLGGRPSTTPGGAVATWADKSVG
jgi:hypothetical protein